MKSKETQEKHFKLNLENDLKKFGYKLSEMHFDKDETSNTYNFLINGNIIVRFDDYRFLKDFIQFYNKGICTVSLVNPISIKASSSNNSYLRKEKDLKRLEKNKEKIRQLISVDNTIKIPQIAEELGITRQGLYKNQELMNLINELKKV